MNRLCIFSKPLGAVLMILTTICFLSAFLTPAGAEVLYDNGPIVNGRGTGVGGADESILQTSLGMGNYGKSASADTGSRLADDFVIRDPAGAYLNAITFFAYETGSTRASTITVVNYRIWNGPPNDAASAVVFGDMTTNRLVHTTWSGIYRVTEAGSGTNSDRPVMIVRASAGVQLAQGTYWLEWQMDGDDALSGPWIPQVTLDGVTTSGNALSTGNGGTTWGNDTDSGTLGNNGFPFILHSKYEYFIPFYRRVIMNAYTSLALRNSSDLQSAAVTAVFYNTSGSQVTTMTETIPAKGQWAAVLSQGQEGWVKITSTQPLTGLCWVGLLDGTTFRPWVMGDITLIPDLARELIVPHVAQNGEWDTSVYVCNPHGESTSVTLLFVDESGSVLYQQTFALPANGTREFDLDDDLLPAGVTKSRGSVKISATNPVAGFAMYYDLDKATGNTCFAGISAVDPNYIER
ncbi:MAG: hypothetical protein JW884_10110 [Deltaproteobacteria bacterium]|nr:hypothetical protein [Deltaproteobacteria bacterium]